MKPSLAHPIPRTLLSACALAALLAAPAAWAYSDGGEPIDLSSGKWYLGVEPGIGTLRNSGNTVFFDADPVPYYGAVGGVADTAGTFVPGYVSTGDADKNTLTVAGTLEVAYGGYALGTGTQADSNTLTIKGTVTSRAAGGSSADGRANGNEVFIEAGGASVFVYGGESTGGNASRNSVTINGGQVGMWVQGGRADGTGNAMDNSIVINGGDVLTAMGGVTEAGDGNATRNTVTLAGGTVRGIVGGIAKTGNATENTVTLTGGTVSGRLLGGVCSGSGCDAVSGNRLIVDGLKNIALEVDIANFERLEFTLPDGIKAGETVFKVDGAATFPAADTDVYVYGLPALGAGESITLIDAAGGLSITPQRQIVTVGDHAVEVIKEGNKLIAKRSGGGGGGGSSTSSSPTMGELGLLLSGLALAGAAAPALRRREKQGKKADTRQ